MDVFLESNITTYIHTRTRLVVHLVAVLTVRAYSSWIAGILTSASITSVPNLCFSPSTYTFIECGVRASSAPHFQIYLYSAKLEHTYVFLNIYNHTSFQTLEGKCRSIVKIRAYPPFACSLFTFALFIRAGCA